jgi:hypothetical protein
VSRDAAAAGKKELVSCAAERNKFCSIYTVTSYKLFSIKTKHDFGLLDMVKKSQLSIKILPRISVKILPRIKNPAKDFCLRGSQC